MPLPPIPPQIIPIAKDAAQKIVVALAPAALAKAKRYWSKDHGSKVKRGAFQECSVEMFGDKACIMVNEDSGEVVMLTSETIQTYRYVKEKYKTSRMKTYYYYDITFKDGSESYVRMSKKYREAMESYT